MGLEVQQDGGTVSGLVMLFTLRRGAKLDDVGDMDDEFFVISSC